jgi:tetratricopeptide (TPR) repeat protein
MENNTRDRELIQGYIDGTLTGSEEVEINYRLREEQGLQKMLAEHEGLVFGIRLAHMKEKLQQLRSLEAGLPPVSNRNMVLRVWAPLAAAAVLIIAAGLWYIIPAETSTSYQELYTAYFEPFDSPGSGLTRSTENEKDLKARAYIAYDAKDYSGASKLFVDLLKQKDDPIAYLCLGSSWLALNKPEEAEKVFTHILQNHGDLVTQAKWYLALTFLRQGKIERTKATLWEISNSSTYGEEARELLRKLD